MWVHALGGAFKTTVCICGPVIMVSESAASSSASSSMSSSSSVTTWSPALGIVTVALFAGCTVAGAWWIWPALLTSWSSGICRSALGSHFSSVRNLGTLCVEGLLSVVMKTFSTSTFLLDLTLVAVGRLTPMDARFPKLLDVVLFLIITPSPVFCLFVWRPYHSTSCLAFFYHCLASSRCVARFGSRRFVMIQNTFLFCA